MKSDERPTGGIFLVAFAFTCLVFAVPLFGLLLDLVSGWVFFLARVVPRLTVSASGLTTAAVCLVLLTVGLHGFLGWLYREMAVGKEVRRWRWRWTFAGLAVIVLMFVAGLSATGVAHQAAWLANSGEPFLRSDFSGATARMSSTNNVKQIALALCSHADDKQDHFPAGGMCDARGTMLHGWQTALLPYIEQNMLYDQIRKDLPWNDPANAPHFQRHIYVYNAPGARPAEDDDDYALSHYAANVRVIGGDVRLTRAKITDGLANTVVAGEAAGHYKPWGHPMNWRDPALGINRSPDGFGNLYRGGATMAFADGSVRFLKESIDPAVLKALSTPAGGEPPADVD